MTLSDAITLAENMVFWLIVWSVFAPLASGLAVAWYYQRRYREGIAMQRHYDKGLYTK